METYVVGFSRSDSRTLSVSVFGWQASFCFVFAYLDFSWSATGSAERGVALCPLASYAMWNALLPAGILCWALAGALCWEACAVELSTYLVYFLPGCCSCA